MLIFLWGSGKISPTGSDGVRGLEFRKKSGADQKEQQRLSQPLAEPALYIVKPGFNSLVFSLRRLWRTNGRKTKVFLD
ncbi:hypothetical protein CIK44_04185 [Bacillus sp. X2(2017)]|nr:hypothetical protein CIK44_04185 [Bacillus sp. X2(2017)]